jgi:hypothetical protein
MLGRSRPVSKYGEAGKAKKLPAIEVMFSKSGRIRTRSAEKYPLRHRFFWILECSAALRIDHCAQVRIKSLCRPRGFAVPLSEFFSNDCVASHGSSSCA